MSQETIPEWIPLDERKYAVQQAYLVASASRAVAMEQVAVRITTGPTGRKHLQGSGRVLNILIVELLERADSLDILLDLGDEFAFLLKMPDIQAGKVFSPDVKATLRFSPVSPWKQLTRSEFEQYLAQMEMIDCPTEAR